MLLYNLKTNIFLHLNSENMSLFNNITNFSNLLVQIDEKLIFCSSSIILGILIGYGALKMLGKSFDEISRSSRLDNDLFLKLKFNKDNKSFHKFKMNVYKAVADTKTVKHLGVCYVLMQNIMENGVSTKKFLGADFVEGVDKILIAEEVPKQMPKNFSMNSLARLTVNARLATLPAHGIYNMFVAGETCAVIKTNFPEISTLFRDDLNSPFFPNCYK